MSHVDVVTNISRHLDSENDQEDIVIVLFWAFIVKLRTNIAIACSVMRLG